MITEDYCSYEVARLLKDKGFDEDTIGFYNSITEVPERIKFFDSPISIYNSDGLIGCIQAPTHQMAMRWLREVHNLFIQICIIPHTTITMEQKYYFFTIHKDRRTLAFRKDFPSEYYFTYEEACEAAIKYCLENLI